MHFDPAGHGVLLANQEVAKGYFGAAERGARRAARVKARGGTFFHRHVTGPATEDLNSSVADAIRNAHRAGTSAGQQTIREADQAAQRRIRQAEEAGARTIRRASIGIGAGVGTGIGGGLTLGALSNRLIDPKRRRQAKREARTQADYALAKADVPAGYYPYLLPTIRDDIAAIPATRHNPISPLQQIAAANVTGEGLADIRSRNPFFRRARTIRGTQQMVMGQQMLSRGAGEPL